MATNIPGEPVTAEEPRSAVLLLAVVGAVFAVYWPVLWRGSFAWDDWTLVVRSPALRSLDPLSHLLASFWGRGHTPYYRPLTTLTLAADARLWGLVPQGFHATNVALHALVAVLLFALSRALGAGRVASAIAALLFGTLPRLSESVAWVSGRTDILATAFVAAALTVRARSESAWARWAAAGLLLGGLLSKEVAVAGAAAWAGTEALRARRTSGGLLAAAAKTAPAGVAVAAYLLLRWQALAGGGSPGPVPLRMPSGAAERVVAALAALGRYAWMLADPLRPRLQHAPPASPTLPAVVTGALVIAAVAVGAVIAWRRAGAESTGVAAGGLAALVLVLDVVPLRLSTATSDRFLYLPVALLLAAVAPLASRAGMQAARALLALSLAAAVVFGARTYARASQWADDVVLWTGTSAEAPWSPVAAAELAAALERAGRRDEALEHYRRAASLAEGPGRIASLKNYALALADVGRVDEAVAELRAAMQLATPTVLDRYNLGVLELKRGRLDEARSELERAAALAPGNRAILTALRAVDERRQVIAPAPPAPR